MHVAEQDFDWTIRLIGRMFRPRTRLRVSEWADAHRILSGKASSEAGPWRTSRTPYLREILDTLSDDSHVQRVVFMKSAQVGATETAVNWIGYVMDHVRTAKPMLVVLPSDDLRTRWVHQRLRPMIESATPLAEAMQVSKSRDGSNRLDLLDYPGGLLYLTSAGSARRLKSDSIRFVVCDECDEYEWDVDGRGDPLGLIESRMANFPRRKVFLLSTPTVKGASRIEGEWERSDQRRYLVPCPHCGEHQVLEWRYLQWAEDLSSAWYSCAANGCLINERDKAQMLERGYWVPKNPGSAVRGYHINALYSPAGLGYGWRELARQWVDAQGEPERVKHFWNERLGLPYEDARTAIKQEGLIQRSSQYALREIPPGVLVITAGVDTQDNRLAVQLVGWGPGEHFRIRWWVLDYVELPGNPSTDVPWTALTELLNQPLQHASGRMMAVSATAIDMGGHKTEEVKAYVRSRRLHMPVMAVVGSNVKQKLILEHRPRKTDITVNGQLMKHGVEYWRIGTENAKDALYAALREDEDAETPEQQAHFSHELDAEYYHQLLSEVWDPKKNRYVEKRGHRQHEVLDTWVYACAASHHPYVRVHRKRPKEWAELAVLYSADGGTEHAETAPQKRKREPKHWIQDREGKSWINRRG